jgi:hypothetical protein
MLLEKVRRLFKLGNKPKELRVQPRREVVVNVGSRGGRLLSGFDFI